MKITQDLRAALKAIIAVQKNKRSYEGEAIKDFFARHPKIRKQYEDAQKKYKAIHKKKEALNAQLQALTNPLASLTGLWWYSPEAGGLPTSIHNQEKFEKVGGGAIANFGTYNGLILRLAQATEVEGVKILKEIGIEWK